MKTQIGLGVLSMPLILGTLGIVPGNILIVVIAAITTWSSYIIGVFKIRHPEVYGIGDVGRMLFGRVGYELFGGVYALGEFYPGWQFLTPLILSDFTFAAGSAMLSISIALNALSSHAVCTAVFVAVAAAAGFGIGSIRTLDRIGFLAWVGTVCIITAGGTCRSFFLFIFANKSLTSICRHYWGWPPRPPFSSTPYRRMDI